MLRVLIIFGWIRIFFRKEFNSLKLVDIDKVFICWVVSSVIVYFLLYQSASALINRLGHAYDALGLYFLIRSVLSEVDGRRIIKVIAIIVMPLSIAMIWESCTQLNPLYFFGGVPQFSELRNGSVRCQGSFSHPILAGTFGATTLPLCLSLWWDERKGKIFSILGIVGCTIITVASQSSGPVSTYILAILAWCFWVFRKNMRIVRWVLFGLSTIIHLMMNAPVWYLYARLAGVIGGSGWHRSELIDQTIRHFDEWWLIGTKYTIHWMDAPNPANPDMVDITNWFVGQAVNGGLLTLILFILVIVTAFQRVGFKLKSKFLIGGSEEKFLWGLGVSLFAHVLSFTSVAYFDQIIFFWFLILVSIASFEPKKEIGFIRFKRTF
jgi:hypothetical protein